LYAGYGAKDYKYSTQLPIILKREYPGKLDDKDDDGVAIKTSPALEWADYYHDDTANELGETAAHRVKQEFWVSTHVQST